MKSMPHTLLKIHLTKIRHMTKILWMMKTSSPKNWTGLILFLNRGDNLTTYDDLLIEADCNNLVTKEKPLRANKGRIKGNRIAIRKDLTQTEKKCVLAEELGHHYTATGNILDQSTVENRKQEMRGRIVAYNKLVGLRGIIDAYLHHCQSLSETAEYLGVTEEFLNDSLTYYTNKYGVCTQVDNYVIFFQPNIGVMELI
nr:MAG TPA: IrrE protein [Caudoviricetes sp.]